MLENVEEFVTWGPLDRDGNPDPKQKGRTFRSFVNALRKHGYEVEWRELRACDFGAPTTRKRLFLIARSDGKPITWPTPTHGHPESDGVKSGRLSPWRTAAECINWGLPTPSIFDRKKELAEATLKRIWRGLDRYVLRNPRPFIVSYYGQKGNEFRGTDLESPLPTQTTENRFGLVTPVMVAIDHQSAGGSNWEAETPLTTITIENRHALVTAFLNKHYTGATGSELSEPLHTITTADHHTVSTAFFDRQFGNGRAAPVTDPLRTITTEGQGKSALVRAFLAKYNGAEKDGADLTRPMDTVTTKDRFGLVTVEGEDYQLVDIGLRMLTPRELFRAQGFPESYIIDPLVPVKRGKKVKMVPLSGSAQVKMCGNSVCPPLARALVEAQFGIQRLQEAAD